MFNLISFATASEGASEDISDSSFEQMFGISRGLILLTFAVAPPRGWNFIFFVECLANFWMDYREIWYIHSFSSQAELQLPPNSLRTNSTSATAVLDVQCKLSDFTH